MQERGGPAAENPGSHSDGADDTAGTNDSTGANDPARKDAAATAAKTAGVPTHYLPERGASDDKIDQMGTSAKLLTLKYYKMTILESPEEIKPTGKVESKQEVKLRNGTGQWITADGQKSLHLKLDKTYIALSSDKLSQADLQTVAESLATLK